MPAGFVSTADLRAISLALTSRACSLALMVSADWLMPDHESDAKPLTRCTFRTPSCESEL